MMVRKGFCIAVATGLLASTSSVFAQELIGGNGLCADPASLGPNAPMGGYTPVDDPSNNDVVTEAAQAAATKFFEDDESSCYQEVIDICGADAQSFADSVKVTAACSQVVAGTNVKVAFSATIPCSDENKAKLSNKDQLTQEFEADVFVPLPSSNEAVDVTSVKETSGKCAKAETPVMVGQTGPEVEFSPVPAPMPAPAPASGNTMIGTSVAAVAGLASLLFM